jgi:hypothetical protein
LIIERDRVRQVLQETPVRPAYKDSRVWKDLKVQREIKENQGLKVQEDRRETEERWACLVSPVSTVYLAFKAHLDLPE